MKLEKNITQDNPVEEIDEVKKAKKKPDHIAHIYFEDLTIIQSDNLDEFLGFKAADIINVSLGVIFPEFQEDGKYTLSEIENIVSRLEKKSQVQKTLKFKHSHGIMMTKEVVFENQGNNVFLIKVPLYYPTLQDDFVSKIAVKDPSIAQIMKNSPVLFRMSNEKNEFYYFSKQWLQFTGKKLKEELKTGWQTHIVSADSHTVLNMLNEAFRKLSKYEITYRLIRHDNQPRWIYESGIPLFDRDGSFIGFLSVSVDVTRIREAEQKFINHEETWRTLTEESPVMFRMSDEYNHVYYFSKQWLKFTGKSLKEQINHGWLKEIHNDDFRNVKDTIDTSFRKRSKFELTYRIKNRDGEYRWILDTGMPLFSQLGEYTGYIAAAIDISERKVADEQKSREKAMVESEKGLQSSFDKSDLVAISIEKKGHITYCNTYFLELLGLDEVDVKGKDINDFIDFYDSEGNTVDPLTEIFNKTGYSKTIEANIKNTFREKFIIRFSSYIFYNKGEEYPIITLIGENITEKRKVRDALDKSNAQLKDLFDNANDLIQIFSPEGNFLFVNKSWKMKLGFEDNEIPSLSFKDILDDSARDQTIAKIQELSENLPSVKIETTLKSRHGEKIIVTGSISASFKNAKLKEYRGIFYDITERVRAEKAQQIYYRISNLALKSVDLEGLYASIHVELKKIITAANFYIALTDKERSTLHFPYFFDSRHKEGPTSLRRKFEDGITEYAIRHKEPLILNYETLTDLQKRGKLNVRGKIPAIWLGVPLYLSDEVIGIISVQSYDNPEAYSKKDLDLLVFISGQIATAIDRKRKDEKIKEQNARLKAIFESGTHMIWSVDKDFQFTSGNKRFIDFFNNCVPESNFFSSESYDETSVNKTGFWADKYNRALEGEIIRFESKFIHRDTNQESWISIVLSPIYVESEKIEEISGIAYDITDNKKSAINLAESEEKFRNIFESFQDIYFRCDFKGNILLLSPSVKELLGYEPEELIGKNITNYYLYSKQTKDLLRSIVRKKSIRNFEASLINKKGKILQFICNLRLVFDNNVKEVTMEGVARDITRLKETNLELKQAKEVAEKSLRVKDMFLANMSHEIRTPMNGIIGMIDLMEGTTITEEQKHYIKTIKKSSETLLNILNDILDLSKIEAGKMQLKKEPVRLENIPEKIYALFSQQALSKNINLYYHLSDNLPEYVFIDETRLLQILSNLVSNAIKFTEGGGSIDINLKRAKIPGKRNMIKCTVSDSGIGISPENTRQLFTLFSQLDNTSTKSYSGTGLGLAISKELTKLMGGKIGVYSTLGHGSSFWFTFEAEPTQKRVVIENEIVENDIQIEGFFGKDSPRILLVDDNSVNRQVAGEILKKAGCEVDLAEDGKKSLELVSEKIYDLIFMDIQMPEMDGVTATKKIKKMNLSSMPPIVAMTAYAMKEDKERFLKQGLDDYIPKPIRANALINKVRQWIDNGIPEIHEQEEEKQNSFQIINLETINQLKNLGGNEMVDQVLGEFIEETEMQLSECNRGLTDQDYERIRSNLHTLKGNAGTLGLERIAKHSEDIEKKLKKETYQTLEQDLKFLNLTFEEFKNKYQEFLT